MKFPEFTSKRLKLDNLREADSKKLFGIFACESVVKYYDLEKFEQEKQAKDLIDFFHSRFKSNVGIRWAIRLKDGDELIGTCGFNAWDTRMKSTVVGYEIDPHYWGRGFASEAVNTIAKAAFLGELPCGSLNRIQADTVPGNFASETVLKKLGFIEEGVRRQAGYWKNAYHDLKCFGLLKEDFAFHQMDR